MFRKLVSNLPYSPALIEDIGFYAKRLRNEDATRKTTLIFVSLALIMQSLAVFSPPESANASSEQDIIRGGVTDLSDFLARYDRDEQDVKDIYTTTGLTRTEIAAARPGTITTQDNTYIMSRYGQLSASDNEAGMVYKRSTGGVGVRYFSQLSSIGGPHASLSGWIGHSAALGWFGIVQSSGGLATHGLPATIDPNKTSDSKTAKTISVLNISTTKPADNIKASPLDKLTYTLRQSNARNVSAAASFSVHISDILEYATLIDGGGGTFNEKTSTLSWPDVQLSPGETQERTFAVQLLSSFPATAAGQSNPASYDCKLTIAFGNQLTTPLNCPAVKTVEGFLAQMPTLGTGLNITFGLLLLTVVTFFYVRNRQLKKEIRIIRHNFNSGAI